MMFSCIIIGYILGKKKLLPDNADKVLSKLATTVLLPAMNISSFAKHCTVSSLSANYRLPLIALMICLISIGLAYAFSGFFSKDSYQKNVYKYALTFGNFGFMGNAIVPAILGDEHLYLYLLFTMPLSVLCHTWGLSILIPSGETKQNPLKRLLNPSVIGLGIGVILGLTGLAKYIPSFLNTSLSTLSSCMGPVAMILTGFVVAKFDLMAVLKKPPVYVATLFRLIVLPALFLLVLILLKAESTVIILSLFAFGTPLGLNTVVFPSAYGGDASTGASMALVSHTLCVITIPLLYAVVSSIL